MTKEVVLRTGKQTQIMTCIVRANPDGTFLDIDQLLEALPYDTTKSSIQFSLRALIKKGFIERGELRKRDGQNRRIIKPTYLGYTKVKAS